MTRDEVIKGLECCVRHFGECDSCPYDMGRWNCGCGKQLYADALALLKAQEPKVMSFDEVISGDECWLEAVNGACGYADCYACTGTGEVQIFRCKYDNPQYITASDYLKTWRCWTSRPTEAEREAIPWMT